MGFLNYIQPKISKMQYWKGENQLKETNLTGLTKTRRNLDPQGNWPYWMFFFLVIIWLKASLFVQDPANWFGISITWINFLYLELKDIFPFPRACMKEHVSNNKDKFGLHWTVYSTTFSHVGTIRNLVRLKAPQHMEIACWGNSKWTSDFPVWTLGWSHPWRANHKRKWSFRFIAEWWVIQEHGFDISGIVPEGVTINMPPFLAGQEKMTAAEAEETMSITSLLIHVKRAIERMKMYHILNGTMPTSSPYTTRIATVCGSLTNFLSPLLPLAKPQQWSVLVQAKHFYGHW